MTIACGFTSAHRPPVRPALNMIIKDSYVKQGAIKLPVMAMP